MDRLVPCASCHRQVRDEESQCPFCGTARRPNIGFLSTLPQQPRLPSVPAYGGPRPIGGPSPMLIIGLAVFAILAIAGVGAAIFLAR